MTEQSPGPFTRSTVNLNGVTVDIETDDPALTNQMVGIMSDAVAENGPEILDQDIPIIIDGMQRGTIYHR